MERRNLNFRVKSVDEAGSFSGMAAVYSNLDLGNDVIDPGAFTRTLSAGKTFPVLWQHNPSDPIGSCKITDTAQGLQLTGNLLLTDVTAQKAYAFMKAGIVKGLSIGYDTLQATYDGDIRHLVECRLWEISVCTFPMNESAQVTTVKAMSDAERSKHVKGLAFHQRGMAMHLKALFPELGDADPNDDPSLVPDDDDDDDDGEEMGKSALLAELKGLVEDSEQLARV